ncbi:DUF5789 family protein [Halomicrococcus sp. SG-WS-1]|uniref:DUF5789 family protein n=1 Tax=Halomicrococcus sp. SG-WS-1 TaxID=3439057 RepID=UPI003F7A2AAC
MTDDEEQEREMGVELGELSDELESVDYPVSADELVSKYGDREIEYGGGSETLESALGPLNEDYESADEVEQSILNMVGSEAVGRQNYTDRGAGHHSDGEEDPDAESF